MAGIKISDLEKYSIDSEADNNISYMVFPVSFNGVTRSLSLKNIIEILNNSEDIKILVDKDKEQSYMLAYITEVIDSPWEIY